jgi:hypothetical protein
MLHASGAVESIDGMTPVGTCGRGDSGCFTVREGKHSAPDGTVELAPTTAVYERGVSSPSFANVRMGDWVGALGTLLAGDTVTATKVDVGTPRVPGSVESVKGSPTAGTRGTAGTSDSFTMTSKGGAGWAVGGSPTTGLAERNASSLSFADVCLGGGVAAGGLSRARRSPLVRW